MKKAVLKRRASQRGAALFIVMMITTLLTAIGVFAIHTSSMVERASGFGRKASQAFYITESSLRTVASDLATNEGGYDACMQKVSGQCRATQAWAAAAPPGTLVTCCTKDARQMANQLDPTRALKAYVGDPSEGGLIGSVGRPGAASQMQSDYRVELTDLGPAPRPIQGNDLSQGDFVFRQVTVTATGHVRPLTGSICSAETAQASSVQSQRAFITYLTRK